MLATVPDILARIVTSKRLEVAALAGRRGELERLAEGRMADRRDFAGVLAAAPPAIIAEVKQASPSAGVLAGDFDPAAVAARYEEGGAAALSVLTDGPFFKGNLSDLEAARERARLPVLRKDFTIDPVSVVEAAAHGADAILLIAAILSEREMRDLRELASGFGMAALVEVHCEAELEPALASGADIIGVNNRNLHTFEVRLDTSFRLAERIPAGVIRVSESGIRSRSEVRQLRDAGYQAFLVGEHLMRSPDPAAALRELIG